MKFAKWFCEATWTTGLLMAAGLAAYYLAMPALQFIFITLRGAMK
jgi:hypothetical protein